MDCTPVITRLRTQLAGQGFVAIAGAAELDAAIANTPSPPAAYVLPLAETADEPDFAGIHHQRVLQEFAVVLVVANLRDVAGAAAAAELQARRLLVRSALLGWAPDAASAEVVAFTAGRLLQFADQRLWWSDEFRVITDYRSA
jgi:hypothetical protein